MSDPRYDDTKEADSILLRALLTTQLGALQDARKKAAIELHRVTETAVDRAGFSLRNVGDRSGGPGLGRFVIDLPQRHASIAVLGDIEAGIRIEVAQEGRTLEATQPALYFDAEHGVFAVARPPGRSPVAAVAECIGRAIVSLS